MVLSLLRWILNPPIHEIPATLSAVNLWMDRFRFAIPADAGIFAAYEEGGSKQLTTQTTGLLNANGVITSDLRIPGYEALPALLCLVI